MSITTFEKLLPLLDIKDLSEFDILLTNKLALDLFDYAKSKGIKEQKMCNWFQQIVSIPINMRNLVTNLHRLKKNTQKKRGLLKETFLQEPFKCPTLNESSICTNKSRSSDSTLATSIAADLHKMQQKKDAEISSLKRKLLDQKDKKKENPEETTERARTRKNQNQRSKQQVKINNQNLKTERKNI